MYITLVRIFSKRQEVSQRCGFLQKAGILNEALISPAALTAPTLLSAESDSRQIGFLRSLATIKKREKRLIK
jgi:hypothetical protein